MQRDAFLNLSLMCSRSKGVWNFRLICSYLQQIQNWYSFILGRKYGSKFWVSFALKLKYCLFEAILKIVNEIVIYQANYNLNTGIVYSDA